MPQPPPPPKLGAGIEDGPPEPAAQLKDDITFFTSLEEQRGHSVFFSAGERLWRSENLSLHFKHIYS
jgi:hypothetical protein